MPWTYKQVAGEIDNPLGKKICVAYSGNGVNKNVHESERIPMHGPIPCGLWKMVAFLKDGGHCGPDIIVLEPLTKEFYDLIASWGRGPLSFRIHGDNATHTASDGCIIVDHADRISMWSWQDHLLTVVPE